MVSLGRKKQSKQLDSPCAGFGNGPGLALYSVFDAMRSAFVYGPASDLIAPLECVRELASAWLSGRRARWAHTHIVRPGSKESARVCPS